MSRTLIAAEFIINRNLGPLENLCFLSDVIEPF